ncbi:MAG: hypothetical protein ACE5KM_08535 [Planctomycetaceae bacterium]
MSLLPRRITFQLTPLLDLLLIVIFAQFLEVRDRTAQGRIDFAKQSSQTASQLNAAKRARDDLQNRLDGARILADELKRQLAANDAESKRAREQRDLVSRTLARMFRMPEAAMRQALKPLASNTAQSKADVAKLRKMLKELQNSKPHQIVRHVVKFRELLKRCDVWELHVDRRNIAHLRLTGNRHEFRYSARPLKLTGDDDRDREERRRYFRDLKKDFKGKLFAFYKSLPQTKSIIIVLISRGPGTTAGTYFAARQGTQETADHISSESGARIQVVSTDLGELRFEPSGDREDE